MRFASFAFVGACLVLSSAPLSSQDFHLVATETPVGSGYGQPVERYRVQGSFGAAVRLSDIPKTMTDDPASVVFRTPFELFVANRAGHKGTSSISRFIFSSDVGSFVEGPRITGNGVTDLHQIAFSPIDGELFATNFKTGVLSRFRFDSVGNAIPNGTVQITDGQPQLGVAVRPADQQLLVSSYTFVRRYRRNTNGSYTLIGNFSPPGATLIHFLKIRNDLLYVPDITTDKIFIYRFDAQGVPVAHGSIAASDPVDTAISPDGKELFTSDHYRGGLSRYRWDGPTSKWVLTATIPTPQLGGLAIGDIDLGGSFTQYGKGCPGTNALTPSLSAIGAAERDKMITMQVFGGVANGVGLMLGGNTQVNAPLPGACTLLALPQFNWVQPLDANGKAFFQYTFAKDFALGDLFFQFAGIDTGSANGLFSMTNGLKVHVH